MLIEAAAAAAAATAVQRATRTAPAQQRQPVPDKPDRDKGHIYDKYEIAAICGWSNQTQPSGISKIYGEFEETANWKVHQKIYMRRVLKWA